MAWGKVDDKLYSSPKWMQVTKGGKALWVSALSWCMSQLTDGEVPHQVIFTLGASTQDARSLVGAGLWLKTQTGYKFHDWLDYQPSREQVLAEREAARQRQQRARDRAAASRNRHGVTHAVSHSEVHPLVTGDVTVPPSRPVPLKPSTSAAADSAIGESFEEWWLHYPKKVDKGQARKPFKAALKKIGLEELISATDSYAEQMKREGIERKFIKNPSTWLNAEAWANQDTEVTERPRHPDAPDNRTVFEMSLEEQEEREAAYRELLRTRYGHRPADH